LEFDPLVAASGLFVGFIVGLTGMGGGALMTPILVLLFGIHPLAAISSDLTASAFMKPVGASVHMRRGSVNFGLVRWLVIGSIPAAFVGAYFANHLGHGPELAARLKAVLGVTLLVACSAIAAKSLLGRKRRPVEAPEEFRVSIAPTIAIGVVGGLIVGLTSVGSGSLMIVLLLLLYPQLSASRLVGTDLMQAIPLVIAAALGHAMFGKFHFDLTLSLVIGSLPGVYLGARVSSRAPDHVIRPVLMVVLLASGLKLIGIQSSHIGLALSATILAVLAVGLQRRRAARFTAAASTLPQRID
jgi:hypothetical protein